MDRHWWIAGVGAVAVVGGALLLLDWLVAQPPRQLSNAMPPARVAVPLEPAAPPIDAAPRADTLADGVLRRCRDGERVLYTDRPCPNGVAARPVALHDTAGFEPPRAPRADTFVNDPEPGRPSAVMLEPVRQVIAGAASCDALRREIEYWDALARQPQSGATQDWIRERRREVQTAQHAAQC